MTVATGQSDVDLVRDATDLVQLIGEHISLKPKGREHVGLCPFHDDHTPSMSVVTHKGNAFYKCHACGASGDAFSFVMKYLKMDFPEALRLLAERAGVSLTPRRAQVAPSRQQAQRQSILKANEAARSYFRDVLHDPIRGAEATEWLARRGISTEMIDAFQLGFAPDGWDGLLTAARRQGLDEATLLAAGLARRRPNAPGCYDAFRHRILFPISDELGRPIAFGARQIDPEDQPKYLNSPETEVFKKSQTLFGLHLAKRAILESKEAIVTEGYTDVIACHQAGIRNAIGTLGTALTREHARLLSRLCDSLILVFDGDEAGQRAADRVPEVLADRGLELFLREDLDVRFCVLPDGMDPDEMLRADDGVSRFRQALERSVDALEYKFHRTKAALGESPGLSARQKHLERFLAELADLGFHAVSGVRKRLLCNSLADLFKVSVADIEPAMPRRPRRAARASTSTRAATSDATEPVLEGLERGHGPRGAASAARVRAEHEVLSACIYLLADQIPSVADVTAMLGPEQFVDPLARPLAAALRTALAVGERRTVQQLFDALDDEAVRNLAAELYLKASRRFETNPEHLMEELTSASEALDACIRREACREQVSAFQHDRGEHRSAQATARATELIQEIRKQGDNPVAIPRGVRSDPRETGTEASPPAPRTIP